MLQFASADEVASALGRDVPTANFDESARSDRQGRRPPPSPPLPPRAASEESTWGTWRGRHEICRTPRSQASAARGGLALPRGRMVVSVPRSAGLATPQELARIEVVRSAEGAVATRVAGAAAWFLHGFVLEMADGSRRGRLIGDKGAELDFCDDDALRRRLGRWEQLRPNEFIIALEGCYCTGKYSRFLAGSMSLRTSFNRKLEFSGEQREHFGKRFSVSALVGTHIVQVFFRDGGVFKVSCADVPASSSVASPPPSPPPVAMSATATPSAKSISAGPMDGIACAHPRCEFLLAQSDSSDGFCCPACLQAYYALRLPELHSPGCCKTRMVPGAARARPSDKSEKGMAEIAYAHWNQGPASLAVPGTPPGEVLLEAPPYSRFKRRRKQLAKAAAPPGSDTDLSFKLPAHRKSPLLAATAEPMEYWMPQTPLGEPPACRLASMRRREPQQPPRLPTGPTRFDGAWRINGGSGQIEQINCGCLEGANYLGLIGEARCVVDIDGETYEGSLSSDKQTISWSDGDTWLRAGNLS